MISRILAAALLCVAFATGAAQAQTLTHRIDTLSGWGGAVNGFQRVGNIGYCGSGQRLVVLDMSNEANIQEIGSVNLYGTVEDLAVRGNYAYVTTEAYPCRLVVVNIAAASTPRVVWMDGGLISAIFIPSPRRLWLYGDVLYVSDGTNVGAFSVADPARPTALIARVPGFRAVDMCIVADRAYASDQGNLRIFSLLNPLQPELLGSVRVSQQGDVYSISVQGTLALVQAHDPARPAGQQQFAAVVDVSNASSPAIVTGSVYDQFVGARRSAWYGSYALVADALSPGPCGIELSEKGLALLDYSNPSSPALVGTYRTNYNSIRDVRVQGDRAYLFCDGQGLEVLNLSSPQQPARIGGYFSPGLVRGCAKAGDRLYVSDAWNGFTVLDVSNANATPVVLGVYRTPQVDRQDHHNIIVRNNVAYLAGGWSGVHLVDVSNPAGMTLLGYIPGPEALSNVVCIDLDGDVLHASVASKPSCCNNCTALTYRNYSVSNPTIPVELGWANAESLANAMASKGPITFYARATRDLELFDNVTPPAPSLWGHVEAGGGDLALEGDILLAARPSAANPGMYILNVADPRNPQQVGFISGGNSARAVAIQGTRAYLSAYRYEPPQFIGVIYTMAFDITTPSAPQLTAYSYAQPSRILADGDLLFTASPVNGSNLALSQGLVIQRYRCASDMDDNGVLNVNDFVAFLNAFAALDFRTDIDRNQAFNVNDFVGYLNLFAAGCD